MEGYYQVLENENGKYDVYWFDNEFQLFNSGELICADFETKENTENYIDELEEN